jgi:hypothetical protein
MFEKPEMSIEVIEVEDIITTSSDEPIDTPEEEL